MYDSCGWYRNLSELCLGDVYGEAYNVLETYTQHEDFFVLMVIESHMNTAKVIGLAVLIVAQSSHQVLGIIKLL